MSNSRPTVETGDIVATEDGAMVGLVLVVDDSGSDRPNWELHVNWLIEGRDHGVSICDPSFVVVANTDENRALLEQAGIRLANG